MKVCPSAPKGMIKPSTGKLDMPILTFRYQNQFSLVETQVSGPKES